MFFILGVVLETGTVERELCQDALVVNRELFDLDGVINNGDHRGGLARQGDVTNRVLEQFADL